MFKINLHLCLLLIFIYFPYGGTINYNPYASNQPHLLHATNTENNINSNNAQSTTNDYTVYQQSEQNLQGNSNYQQLYRYYYTPSSYQQQYQQQEQQHLQPHQPTHLWSGPPIVVEDDISPTFYKQYPTTSSTRSSNTLLPSLHRNSKVLPPLVYNPQIPLATRQLNYNNNNNNNIVYHRDFRHQIDAIPESQQHQQQDIASWHNQQQQQQQQPQQFYATNTNLRYNGISNDLSSLSKDNAPDYTEHFKRYLENNPHRIRPIY